MPEEPTTPDLVELTRQSMEALWGAGMIVRVVATQHIGEARATAERLAEERG
jgi:hypothetical protein